MTLRLPSEVARGVERLARRFGHRPAQVGARLVEEGLRRRDFPQIELRDTLAGRVSYLAGTRFAVYWIAQMVRSGVTPEQFAKQYELPGEHVRAALAYAATFAKEIEDDTVHAESNRAWLQKQEAASYPTIKTRGRTSGKHGKQKVAG